MITPMKKVTVLCLAAEKKIALEEIRELGVIHVQIEKPEDSSDRSELQTLLSNIDKTIAALSTRNIPPEPGGSDGRKLFEKAYKLGQELNVIDKELEALRRNHEILTPWGDFSPELVKELTDKGIHVYLCESQERQFLKIQSREGLCCEKLSAQKGRVRFVVIANQKLDETLLPLAVIPDDTRLGKVNAQIKTEVNRREAIIAELDKLAAHLPELNTYKQQTAEHFEFVINRDSMGSHGEIASICGFIPVPEVKKLSAAAKKHGWALMLEEPTPDEHVPTLIKLPKIFNIAKPIFEFIGVLPGYYEQDVSVCFLFFFTIFFGMIVGDAGYGLVFLVVASLLKFKFRHNPKVKLQLNLFLVLSTATFIWGALSGNYFGIATTSLPKFMQGIKELTDPAVKDKNVQWFCFLLAAVHLSLGRLWQAFLNMRHRKALGEIGWGMLIWANFFTANELIIFPGSFPVAIGATLYIGGIILILTCAVNWREVGDIFNLPFGLIGSFVDVLSYIRLFAVGMSTYYIASSFNNMSEMLMGCSSSMLVVPFLILGGIIVILFGHVLNIALAFMGVLVHGIRLNTLEFSNHMGMTWAGQFYKPFKRTTVEKTEKHKGDEKND
ncbi:MAG: hypothetical protein WC071_00235 [Victivallaceae bacterium]